MILSTHAIIGGSLGATLGGSPLLALAIGIASHFVSDAIPHWHYPINEIRKKISPKNQSFFSYENSFEELLLIAGECILGFIMIFLFGLMAGQEPSLLIWGAIGGVFPDFLQFVYYFIYKKSPIAEIQRFHKWIHSKKNIDHKHLIGISSQALISLSFILLMFL